MLKIGEYFRTPWGDIGKITDIPKHNKYFDDGFYLEGKFITCGSKVMKELNSTPNIIDLIDLGDLVKVEVEKDNTNVFEIVAIDKSNNQIGVFNNNFEFDWADIEQVKSIVTKEQFESIEYRIGE